MIEPGCEIDENELMKINWAGLLIPTLRLSKIVINSLGKFHVCYCVVPFALLKPLRISLSSLLVFVETK